MRQRKRPRPNDSIPFNPYDIMHMTAEEVAPLLWEPRVIHTLAGDKRLSLPERVYLYGVVVRLDEESEQRLTTGNRRTWLKMYWCPKDKYSHTAPCKVLLMGIDDSNYGAWLTARSHQGYMDTWHKLLAFLNECGAREFGLNGEYLLDYCDEHLDAYERDYN